VRSDRDQTESFGCGYISDRVNIFLDTSCNEFIYGLKMYRLLVLANIINIKLNITFK